MWRWIVNILAAFSVLMLLGIGWLWVRSYWVGDRVRWVPADGLRSYGIQSTRGRVLILHIVPRQALLELAGPYDPASRGWHREQDHPPVDDTSGPESMHGEPSIRFLGIDICWSVRSELQEWIAVYAAVVIPDYWLLPPCLPFPLIWLRRWRRRRLLDRRARMGLCMVCGYDLRASPERCPECGTGRFKVEGSRFKGEG